MKHIERRPSATRGATAASAGLLLVGAAALLLACTCVRVVVVDRDDESGRADSSGTPVVADTNTDSATLDVAPVETTASSPSCSGGLTCQGISCCDSKTLPGGTFMQGRATAGPENDVCSAWFLSYPDCDANEQPEFHSTVASFALDTDEVTVGRFRKFVEAYPGGQPALGAGANANVTGSGWDASWMKLLPADRAQLIANVACDPAYATWTDAPATNENKPINCLDWYAAFAFCAWDGGRLPTEAEWEFAASGGENRVVPWEIPPADAVPDNTRAIFGCLYDTTGYCTGVGNVADVGSTPLGASRWGQHDMAGNAWEWCLDAFAPYDTTARTDYANLASSAYRVMRGGSFFHRAGELRAAKRGYNVPWARSYAFGVRCARSAL